MAERELDIIRNLSLTNQCKHSFRVYGCTNKTFIQICVFYISLCNLLLYSMFSIKRGLIQEQQNMKSCQQKIAHIRWNEKRLHKKQTEQTSWDYVAVAKN